ncbi:MAG TPA: peptide chain release factor N(5)-glutamine methyltransferase [Burkholderiaceae bacterium]
MSALTPGPSPTDAGEGSRRSAGELIASSGILASEARTLLAFALNATRESLIAHPQLQVPPGAADRFRALCRRRQAGEPMAYLRMEREFFGRRFRVDPAVLIPRPETECLVQAALEALKQFHRPSVLDLGTGSGCIAITLALERADAEVSATDLSEAALELARANAVALGARVEFIHGNWYGPIRRRYDLIVSNPPYVAVNDPHLAELANEPLAALTDGADGLTCLRAVLDGAPACLTSQGTLLIEHGYDQGALVRAMATSKGFRAVRTRVDLAGADRICIASNR